MAAIVVIFDLVVEVIQPTKSLATSVNLLYWALVAFIHSWVVPKLLDLEKRKNME